MKWRQTAQDGVQLANQTMREAQNQPLYLAPGNRIDLLVQAPRCDAAHQPIDVRIQNVMARGAVKPIPVKATQSDRTRARR